MCNVPLLSKYLLEPKWADEINEENPLGMQGFIAKTFAALIQGYWTGTLNINLVRDFKVSFFALYPIHERSLLY